MKFSVAIVSALSALASALPTKDAAAKKHDGVPSTGVPSHGPPGWSHGAEQFSLYAVPVDAGRRQGWRNSGQYPWFQVSADVAALVNNLRLSTSQFRPDTFSVEGSGYLHYTGLGTNIWGGFQLQPTQDSGNVGAVPFVLGNSASQMNFSGDLSIDQTGRLSKGWNPNGFYICPTWSQDKRTQNLALNFAQNGVWDNGASGCYAVWVYRSFGGRQTFH